MWISLQIYGLRLMGIKILRIGTIHFWSRIFSNTTHFQRRIIFNTRMMPNGNKLMRSRLGQTQKRMMPQILEIAWCKPMVMMYICLSPFTSTWGLKYRTCHDLLITSKHGPSVEGKSNLKSRICINTFSFKNSTKCSGQQSH